MGIDSMRFWLAAWLLSCNTGLALQSQGGVIVSTIDDPKTLFQNNGEAGLKLEDQLDAQIEEQFYEQLLLDDRLDEFHQADEQEKSVGGWKMNIMMMIADDFNAEMGHLGSSTAYTPNLDALAAESVSFPHAYSHHPICAPARASLLYGVYGFHSGFDWFEAWYTNPVLRNSNTIMEHFKNNGYETFGRGKIFHPMKRSTGHEFEEDLWTELSGDNVKADYGPYANSAGNYAVHPDVPEPISKYGAMMSYSPLENEPEQGWINTNLQKFHVNDQLPDEKTADWAVGKLQTFAQKPEWERKPFLMVLGFMKPHMPLHVSQEWYDKIKDVPMPETLEGDESDIHYLKWAQTAFKDVRETNSYDAFNSAPGEQITALYRSYLAAKASTDHCIGQVVQGLKNHGFWGNTIVVVTADHGFSIGQKLWVGKWSPYEESTRVPLIIRAPGVSLEGIKPYHAVGHVDIFPTLLDLTGLPDNTIKDTAKGHKLDGHSLKPFLRKRDRFFSGPKGAVSLIISDCNQDRYVLTVRTTGHRYIMYGDGIEEMYNHFSDKHEWHNLLFTGSSDEKVSLLSQNSSVDIGELTVETMATKTKMKSILEGILGKEAFKTPDYKTNGNCTPDESPFGESEFQTSSSDSSLTIEHTTVHLNFDE